VIDDDLGRSAAGGVQRAGFERMVAQVCLGKVGAVAAREVSRFARNSRDWQQLIALREGPPRRTRRQGACGLRQGGRSLREMCRVVDTVLVDQETVYAPRHGNDRLLLGLKGSLNEYELDLLRQRSRAPPSRLAVLALHRQIQIMLEEPEQSLSCAAELQDFVKDQADGLLHAAARVLLAPPSTE